jgi:hypothetical protein
MYSNIRTSYRFLSLRPYRRGTIWRDTVGEGEINVEGVVLVEEEGKNASSGPAGALITIARRTNTRTDETCV